jgi:hypothetical protein
MYSISPFLNPGPSLARGPDVIGSLTLVGICAAGVCFHGGISPRCWERGRPRVRDTPKLTPDRAETNRYQFGLNRASFEERGPGSIARLPRNKWRLSRRPVQPRMPDLDLGPTILILPQRFVSQRKVRSYPQSRQVSIVILTFGDTGAPTTLLYL